MNDDDDDEKCFPFFCLSHQLSSRCRTNGKNSFHHFHLKFFSFHLNSFACGAHCSFHFLNFFSSFFLIFSLFQLLCIVWFNYFFLLLIHLFFKINITNYSTKERLYKKPTAAAATKKSDKNIRILNWRIL